MKVKNTYLYFVEEVNHEKVISNGFSPNNGIFNWVSKHIEGDPCN